MSTVDSPYSRLGMPRAINAMGAVTFLGGLPMRDEVREAMHVASSVKVDLFEFSQVAGARIADLLGAEAAMLTTGAAAGWQLSAAACLAGDDKAAIAELPRVTHPRNEIVMHRKHRGNFDHALRAAGAKIVEFGYSRDQTEQWELTAALTERTAAVAYVTDYGAENVLTLDEVVELSHGAGVSVIVDAALSLPPVENLRDIPGTGADLVSFSGGKALGGPQNTGFVVGSAELIELCRANTSPNHNTVGRAMKLPPEHMVGLITALELYLARDHEGERAQWRASLEQVGDALAAAGVDSWIEDVPVKAPPIPKLVIPVDSPDDVASGLRGSDPAIYVSIRPGAITVCPHAIAPADFEPLAEGLVVALARS